VQNVEETSLAWALIDIAKPYLNAAGRNYVFVATGAGDTFAAIHRLLTVIAAKNIRLIDGFLLPDAIRALTTVGASPLLTAPKRTEPLWVSHITSHAVGTR
jgi:hypothetical protein